jgi:CDP-diacylglycerol pyrophosphatase
MPAPERASRRRRAGGAVARTHAAAAALAVALTLALGLATTPARAARDDLQLIVQQQCVPNWLMAHDPAPCEAVEVRGGDGAVFSTDVRRSLAAGYALLADRKGGAHLLLVPLHTISGIESPILLASGTTNYFAAAWSSRQLIATAAGRPLTRDQVGLAVNSHYTRGQDQLHIHMECQGQALRAALQAQAAHLSDHWSALEVAGQQYQARRVPGENLTARPFELLAAGVPGARADMGAYTLVVAGVQFADGPGFALLARRALMGGGELLLDASCAVAR